MLSLISFLCDLLDGNGQFGMLTASRCDDVAHGFNGRLTEVVRRRIVAFDVKGYLQSNSLAHLFRRIAPVLKLCGGRGIGCGWLWRFLICHYFPLSFPARLSSVT